MLAAAAFQSNQKTRISIVCLPFSLVGGGEESVRTKNVVIGPGDSRPRKTKEEKKTLKNKTKQGRGCNSVFFYYHFFFVSLREVNAPEIMYHSTHLDKKGKKMRKEKKNLKWGGGS